MIEVEIQKIEAELKTFVREVYIVSNSDDTYSQQIDADFELPDITFTDYDGSTSQVPSVKDISATQLSFTNSIVFYFDSGSSPSITITISAEQAATYDTNVITNVSSVAYEKNGSAATLPITLAENDTLRVEGSLTDVSTNGTVELRGDL